MARWIKEPTVKLDHYQNPYGGRRELTPTSCPDFHMQSITWTQAHMLACNLKIKGSEREKPRQADREKQQQKYYTEANSMSGKGVCGEDGNSHLCITWGYTEHQTLTVGKQHWNLAIK